MKSSKTKVKGVEKAQTGISGLDEITQGGLPRGRPTLVCGTAGCGKSLLATTFLVEGVRRGEPGVLMTFEEGAEDIKKNVASLGYDLEEMIAKKKLRIDHVRVERSEIEENGEYDLEGLFVRLNYAIEQIGAKRVVLDTIEALFSGLSNPAILRSEIRRLFEWLKAKGMTTVITGESGDKQLTRQGLEEYVSDCVILLDHRVINQVSTRRLRVVKYRGSTHGTNEYPFLIDADGITVLPVTSLALDHVALKERITTGVERLDAMLGGKGYYRGSSILVTGSAGTGKSSLAAHFADATCRGGEKVLYFAFEESRAQISRNMASIGIDLLRHEKKGLLHFFNARPTAYGLEMHLTMMHKLIQREKPRVCILDPITNLISAASSEGEVKVMLTRLIDYLKMQQITAFFTSLTTGGGISEATDVEISSLMDTWLQVRYLEMNGERNRALYVLKSRGMSHSNQVREFLLTDTGLKVLNVYTGPSGMLTGSARLQQEAREQAEQLGREESAAKTLRDLARKRNRMESLVRMLREEFESEAAEISQITKESGVHNTIRVEDRREMATKRHADTDNPRTSGKER